MGNNRGVYLVLVSTIGRKQGLPDPKYMRLIAKDLRYITTGMLGQEPIISRRVTAGQNGQTWLWISIVRGGISICRQL
jgi:hypothetical protein